MDRTFLTSVVASSYQTLYRVLLQETDNPHAMLIQPQSVAVCMTVWPGVPCVPECQLSKSHLLPSPIVTSSHTSCASCAVFCGHVQGVYTDRSFIVFNDLKRLQHELHSQQTTEKGKPGKSLADRSSLGVAVSYDTCWPAAGQRTNRDVVNPTN